MTTLKMTFFGFLALLGCVGMFTAPSEIARISFSVYVCSMLILAWVAVKDIIEQFKPRRFS